MSHVIRLFWLQLELVRFFLILVPTGTIYEHHIVQDDYKWSKVTSVIYYETTMINWK
jgi:hypothetical protein